MSEKKFIGKWTEKHYGNNSYSFMEENKGVYEAHGTFDKKIDFKWNIYFEYEFKIYDETIKLEHSDKYEGILVIKYEEYLPMIFYYRFNDAGNTLYLNSDNELSTESELVFIR